MNGIGENCYVSLPDLHADVFCFGSTHILIFSDYLLLLIQYKPKTALKIWTVDVDLL